MNMKTASLILSFAALTVALAISSGCASKGNYEKGASAGAGLQEAADKLTIGKGKIDTTLTALNDLVNSSQGDLEPKYKKFSASVNDLQTSAQHVNAAVKEMRDKGNEYFKAWDQQAAAIKNEDIKARSTERKAEMQKKFMDIKRSYILAGDAFKPFMADLKDIQTALGTDLTTGGLGAVKGAVEKANKNAVPLKASVDELATHFKDLGVAMSAAAAAAQSAPAPK